MPFSDEGDGAIHRPGFQEGESEFFGDQASHGGFSCSCRSVYGDNAEGFCHSQRAYRGAPGGNFLGDGAFKFLSGGFYGKFDGVLCSSALGECVGV